MAVDLDRVIDQLRLHYQEERKHLREIFETMSGSAALRSFAEAEKAIARFVEPINFNIASSLAPMRKLHESFGQLGQVAKTFQPVHDFAQFQPTAPFKDFADQIARIVAVPQHSFPDLSLLTASFSAGLIEAAEALLLREQLHANATERLAAHNWRLARGILTDRVASELVDLGSGAKSSDVIRTLGRSARSAEFRAQLLDSLDAHPRSRRRVPILLEALDAHKARRYALSVPVFVAQAEGIVTDFLADSRLAQRVGRRVYLLDPATGVRKVDKNGKPRQLVGLSSNWNLPKKPSTRCSRIWPLIWSRGSSPVATR